MIIPKSGLSLHLTFRPPLPLIPPMAFPNTLTMVCVSPWEEDPRSDDPIVCFAPFLLGLPFVDWFSYRFAFNGGLPVTCHGFRLVWNVSVFVLFLFLASLASTALLSSCFYFSYLLSFSSA